MNKIAFLILGLITFATGCSINHPVAKSYDAHLVKYGSEKTLPKSEVKADYLIGRETQSHSYQFRAATVGYAHVWIVEFGKILDKTIQSDYVQSAFGRLDRSTSEETASSYLVEFDLVSFEFKNYKAYTTLRIKYKNGDNEVLSKSYTSEGGSQGGQMWAAGPFGMKNATLKSTKQSIDDILEQFINDINANKTVKN